MQDKQGMKAEREFAEQFNATLETNLDLQYKDIDAWITTPEGVKHSVSIKDQTWGALQYGNICFEYMLESTLKGKTMGGSFTKCEARWYAIKVDKEWLMFRTSHLRKYIELNKQSFRNTHTRATLEKANREEGRTFDRGWMYLIPLKELRQQTIKIIPLKN